MKLARAFPSVRRLERDNERLRRERKRHAHSNVKRAETVSTLEELLDACEQRQIRYGKITFKEVEEVLTAIVDYRRNFDLIGAVPDSVWPRIKDLFDKYEIKVIEPTPTWHPNSQ